jgi:tetratricopeptide (TPR) repeat protein
MAAWSASAHEVNKQPGVQQIQMASVNDSGLASHPITDSEGISRENRPMLAKDYNGQGVTYSEQGQYDLAILEFNKALEIDPGSTETYNNRGITYSKKDQFDLAISDFSKALNIDPKDTKVLYNRALTYAIEGQFDLALSDLKKCLELVPSNADAYDFRGILYEELACLDWAQACKYGDCDHLKEAKNVGICSDMNTTLRQ